MAQFRMNFGSNTSALAFVVLPLMACEGSPDGGTPADGNTGPSATTTTAPTSPSPSAPTANPTTGSPTGATSSNPTSAPVTPTTSSQPTSSSSQTVNPSTTTATSGPTNTSSEPEGETTTSAPPSTSEPGPTGSDPCATALLCDNFDDDPTGMAPGAPWKSENNGGAVSVSNVRAFSGNNSVHVSNEAGAYKRAYFSVDGAPVFPGAGQELYGRLMMWLETSPADGVHWTFIQGEGPSEDNSYEIFYRYGGQHQGKLMANFETQGVSSDCWNHSQTVMPTKAWTCLEWRFNVATDEMQFWLDGTEVTDLHVVGQGNAGSGCVAESWSKLWPAPRAFDTLRLGLEKYQNDAALNLWIDDVGVGTERLGCPTAQ